MGDRSLDCLCGSLPLCGMLCRRRAGMWLFGALHRTCVDFIMMNLFSRLTDSQNRVIVPEPECSPAWLERETMGVLVLEIHGVLVAEG